MTAYILDALRPLAVAIESLHPDPANARTHNARNLDAIKASLAKFGQRKPIVVQRQGMVVRAGNGTLAAAKALGWVEIAAVVVDESDIEATGFAIADNRSSELAAWDEDVLGNLLAHLQAAPDFDATLTGFSAAEIERMLGPVQGLCDADEIPEPPAEPTSRPGDVWRVGPHRILQGDARDPTALARLMDGRPAACLWTDPPFGVRYVGRTTDALTIENDVEDGLGDLLRSAFGNAAAALEPGSPFYIVHPPGELALEFHLALRDLGWRVHQGLCWAKDALVLGHSDYHHRFEPILYGWTPGPGRSGRGAHEGSRWYGDNAQDSVFEVPRPKRSTEHPTTKPVALIARCLRNSTPAGGLVLDCFAGSGSTAVAAHQLGRVCCAMDVDGRYVDVAVRRLSEFTGLPAERVCSS